MPWGVLLWQGLGERANQARSSRAACTMHAARQEITGGHDGPRGGGSHQILSKFGLQPERHLNRNRRFRRARKSESILLTKL